MINTERESKGSVTGALFVGGRGEENKYEQLQLPSTPKITFVLVFHGSFLQSLPRTASPYHCYHNTWQP